MELPVTVRELVQKLELQRAGAAPGKLPALTPAVTRPPLRATQPPFGESNPPLQGSSSTGGAGGLSQTAFEQKIEKRLDTLEELIKQLTSEMKDLKKLKTQSQQAGQNANNQVQATPPPTGTQAAGQQETKDTDQEAANAAQQAAASKLREQNRAQAEQYVLNAQPLTFVNPDRLRHLERAVELAPEEWEYFRLYLHALCCQQHFDTAVTKGEQALVKFKDDPFILLMTGYAKYMTEQYAAARIDLDKAVTFDQSSLQAHYYLGLTLAKINPQAARLQLNKFIALAESDPEQQEFIKEARAELSALK
jgi:tetratricopeptide (TPR) repeat protein